MLFVITALRRKILNKFVALVLNTANGIRRPLRTVIVHAINPLTLLRLLSQKNIQLADAIQSLHRIATGSIDESGQYVLILHQSIAHTSSLHLARITHYHRTRLTIAITRPLGKRHLRTLFAKHNYKRVFIRPRLLESRHHHSHLIIKKAYLRQIPAEIASRLRIVHTIRRQFYLRRRKLRSIPRIPRHVTIDAANKQTERLPSIAPHKLQNTIGRGFGRTRISTTNHKARNLLKTIHLRLIHRMVLSRSAYPITKIGKIVRHTLHPRIGRLVVQI